MEVLKLRLQTEEIKIKLLKSTGVHQIQESSLDYCPD